MYCVDSNSGGLISFLLLRSDLVCVCVSCLRVCGKVRPNAFKVKFVSLSNNKMVVLHCGGPDGHPFWTVHLQVT